MAVSRASLPRSARSRFCVFLLSCLLVSVAARCTTDDGSWAPVSTACVSSVESGAPVCGKDSGILLESYTARGVPTTTDPACTLPTGTLRINPDPRQHVPCVAAPCAIHCIGSWGAWGPCQPRTGSRACGLGLQVRNFTVHVPAVHPGLPCPEEEPAARRAASRACALPVFPCEPEVGAEACSDGIDNDGDGLRDALAPGCQHITCPAGELDACFVCGGDGSSCSSPTCGGASAPFVVPDACGVCGGRNDSCLACDGAPGGPRVLSSCGICGGSEAACPGAGTAVAPAPTTEEDRSLGCADGWTGPLCDDCLPVRRDDLANVTITPACIAPRSAPDRYALKFVSTPYGRAPPTPGRFGWEGDWWYPSQTPRHLSPDGITRGCDCLPVEPVDCGPLGVVLVRDGVCRCPPGWYGPGCSRRSIEGDGGGGDTAPSTTLSNGVGVLACPPAACGSHGTCRLGAATWGCDCVPGWEGADCTISRADVISYLLLSAPSPTGAAGLSSVQTGPQTNTAGGRDRLQTWELGLISGLVVLAVVPLGIAMYVRRLRNNHEAMVARSVASMDRVSTAPARAQRRWVALPYGRARTRGGNGRRAAELPRPPPVHPSGAAGCVSSLTTCCTAAKPTKAKNDGDMTDVDWGADKRDHREQPILSWISHGAPGDDADADTAHPRYRSHKVHGMAMNLPRVPTLREAGGSSSCYDGYDSYGSDSDDVIFGRRPPLERRASVISFAHAEPISVAAEGEAAAGTVRVLCAEICGKTNYRSIRTTSSDE